MKARNEESELLPVVQVWRRNRNEQGKAIFRGSKNGIFTKALHLWRGRLPEGTRLRRIWACY